MRIKNWDKFQHFKDRRPPWIKLHREILDQLDINMISDCAFRVLICLWLVASEDKDMNGNLPPVEEIAFKIRMPVDKVSKALQELTHFIDDCDINAISTRYQHDEPEKRRVEAETEVETETYSRKMFDAFWAAFDYKKGKEGAKKSWKKIKLNDGLVEAILAGAKAEARSRQSKIDNGMTPIYAQGWLTGKRWEDDYTEPVKSNQVGKKSNKRKAIESLMEGCGDEFGMAEKEDNISSRTIDVTPSRLLAER
jgi:hypothetical protein